MKKYLLVTISLMLCLSFLSACVSVNTVTTETAVKATTTSAPAEDGRPPLLKNSNVTMPGEFPVVKEKEVLSVGMSQLSNVLDYTYEGNYQTKWMQDLSNVEIDLQLFPTTDAAQKLNLMIASNSPLPDILIKMGIDNDAVRYNYGKAGAIIPVNEYYEQLGTLFESYVLAHKDEIDYLSKEELFNYTVSPNGNLYGMISYSFTLPNAFSRRAWLNKKWLDNLGLSEPTTSEELLNVLRAFRDNDPNGNKLKDEIPMVGFNSTPSAHYGNPLCLILNQFIYIDSQQSGNYFILNDGVIDVAYDKEEWREGLRFAKQLIDEELLSTLSFTQSQSQYNAMVGAETQIVGIGVSQGVGSYNDNKVDVTPLGAIKGPNGAQWVSYRSQPPTVTAAITRDCKSPDLAFRWLEMGYTDDNSMISRFGEPGVDFVYTKEGETMYKDMGYKPLFVMKNNLWGQPHAKHWQSNPLPQLQLSRINQGEVWNGDITAGEYLNSIAVGKLFDYVPKRENIIFKIIYNDEEMIGYPEMRTALIAYVNESMVRFVMGDMDLDRDWNKYLNELEKLKYKELLAIDNKAYRRTIGK